MKLLKGIAPEWRAPVLQFGELDFQVGSECGNCIMGLGKTYGAHCTYFLGSGEKYILGGGTPRIHC